MLIPYTEFFTAILFGSAILTIILLHLYNQGNKRRFLTIQSDSSGSNQHKGENRIGVHKIHHQPNYINEIDLDHSPVDLKMLESRAKTLYSTNPDAPMLMTIIDELITRKMPQWFMDDSGLFIKNANILKHRLDFVRNHYSRDCRPRNVLLYVCTLTKLDAPYLQEWLVWQLVVVGVSHVLVYMNDPRSDNTEHVLRPFVDAGFVTAFNFTGSGRQTVVYDHCIDIIRKKSCHYKGPDLDPVFMNVSNCKVNEDYDVFNGTDRKVWMAGFDTDEFPLDSTGACVVNALSNQIADVNGIMLPWQCFGHNLHFLTPPGKLVIESYTTRVPRPVIVPGQSRQNTICKNGKAFNRVWFISKMTHGHEASFKNKLTSIDEFGNYSNFMDVYTTPHPAYLNPRLRLHHYVTKSVEQLVKKYLRGLAHSADASGRPLRRDISQIVQWLRGYATEWQEEDRSAEKYAPMIRAVLLGPAGSSGLQGPAEGATEEEG